MKNRTLSFAAIALVSVFGLSLLACSFSSPAGKKTNDDSMIKMVKLPSGTFWMGSSNVSGHIVYDPKSESSERLPRKVTLSGFWMGIYEITVEQYLAVTGKNPNSYLTGQPVLLDAPVEWVSWYEAIVFCNKLSYMEGLSPAYSIDGNTNPDTWGSVPKANSTKWNAVQIVPNSKGFRLPTEAQWEYACRAGKNGPYHCDIANLRDYGWYRGSYTFLRSAGLLKPNVFGLYDMYGNVAELCWDWLSSSYPNKDETNPTGAASGTYRVFRGGGLNSPDDTLRSAYRNGYMPHAGGPLTGFRVVRP